MVVFYDDEGMIQQVVHFVNEPNTPLGATLEEKRLYYRNELGWEFIAIEEDLVEDILDYKLIFDEDGEWELEEVPFIETEPIDPEDMPKTEVEILQDEVKELKDALNILVGGGN